MERSFPPIANDVHRSCSDIADGGCRVTFTQNHFNKFIDFTSAHLLLIHDNNRLLQPPISAPVRFEHLRFKWMKLVDILSEDINGTIYFFRTKCTADEFIWNSEIFEEITFRNSNALSMICSCLS